MKINMIRSVICAILLTTVFTTISVRADRENFAGKIIVNVTEARVRSAPNLKAGILGATKLGTVYPIVGQKPGWYNINFNEGYSGWISATIVEPFDESRRSAIYQKIAGKYLNRTKIDFDTASELFEFLSNIQPEVAGSNAESYFSLNRLIALAAALDAMPFDKIDKPPYKTFADNNEPDIVYSEPAGQYFVNADRFWDLREKFSALPIAEEIAWRASETNLPGECEGYVVCHLYNLRETSAKYLEYYPNGTHSKKLIEVTAEYLKMIADGAGGDEKTGFYITSEPDDRTQLEQHVSELREIIFKISSPLKSKIIGYLDTINSGYQPKPDDKASDPELLEFWDKLRTAVMKRDKFTVAEMTKFPFQMPHLQQPIKTKAEFIKRYDNIFNGEADAAECFQDAELRATGVYCSFRNAPVSADKPIFFLFEKTDAGYKLAGLDNINE